MLDLDRSNWTRVKFGNVVTNKNETVKKPDEEGIDRVLGLDNLDGGELEITRWGDIADGTTFTRRVRPGQTLFGKRRAYQRKTAYATFDAICSGDILVFESADIDVLLPELLPFLAMTDRFYDHALGTSAGSLSPRTKWADLAKFEFDLPPLDQQKRIADLLWASEAHRNAHESVGIALREATRTYCLNSYQLARELGRLTAITEVADLVLGRQKSPKYATGEFNHPFLSVANVGELELVLSGVQQMDFQSAELERLRLMPGDILMTEGDIVSAHNVGRPAMFQGEIVDCCFQNTLIRLRPKEGVSSGYLLAVIEGMRLSGVLAATASTTTVSHLGLGRLKALQFPLLMPTQQLEVSTQLSRLLEARRVWRVELAAMASTRTSLLREVLS